MQHAEATAIKNENGHKHVDVPTLPLSRTALQHGNALLRFRERGICAGRHKSLYLPEQLVTGKEDASD